MKFFEVLRIKERAPALIGGGLLGFIPGVINGYKNIDSGIQQHASLGSMCGGLACRLLWFVGVAVLTVVDLLPVLAEDLVCSGLALYAFGWALGGLARLGEHLFLDDDQNQQPQQQADVRGLR